MVCLVSCRIKNTPDTGQDTCRVPAYPWHWSGYVQSTRIPLALIRIRAEYLHTPGTGQDTCRVLAYPWHWSGYEQSTCIPLTLVRIRAEYLHTPGTGQDTCRVPAHPWYWSGYVQSTCIPLTLVSLTYLGWRREQPQNRTSSTGKWNSTDEEQWSSGHIPMWTRQ